MTDRYSAYTVVLEKDIRDDDAEAITKAIMMIRGVAKVSPIVSDVAQHVAETRIRSEIQSKIYDFANSLYHKTYHEKL
jgi:hypothetical protein